MGNGTTASNSSTTVPVNNTDKKKNDDCPLTANDHDHSESAVPLTLRIKCTSPGINTPSNPTGDYEIVTHSTAIVSTLKETIRNGIGQSSRGRYLRLIAGGRLLAPDTAPISKFNINDGDCVHAVLAAAGVRGGMQAAMARGLSVNDVRPNRNNGSGINHTGLVVPIRSDESDDEDLEAGRERRGFDRLREHGLTRDEIGAIRLYFSQNVDRFMEQQERRNEDRTNNNSDNNENSHVNSDTESDLDSRRERLRMEDEWMNSQGPHSEFWLNLNANNPLLSMANARRHAFAQDDLLTTNRSGINVGTDRDFIWGFSLGFFVGFMMMFFVWMPTVPHKQKLGILSGISIKLALTMLQRAGDDNDFDV